MIKFDSVTTDKVRNEGTKLFSNYKFEVTRLIDGLGLCKFENYFELFSFEQIVTFPYYLTLLLSTFTLS